MAFAVHITDNPPSLWKELSETTVIVCEIPVTAVCQFLSPAAPTQDSVFRSARCGMWGSSFVKVGTEGFSEGIVEKRLNQG